MDILIYFSDKLILYIRVVDYSCPPAANQIEDEKAR